MRWLVASFLSQAKDPLSLPVLLYHSRCVLSRYSTSVGAMHRNRFFLHATQIMFSRFALIELVSFPKKYGSMASREIYPSL
jgi:hypothetical protein